MTGFRPLAGASGPPTPAFTETLRLNVRTGDANATPADAAALLLRVAQSDAALAATERVRLGISGSGVSDVNAAPTDAKAFTMRIWLAGNAMTSANGVTNPANADGQNNGTLAVCQTVALGANTARFASAPMSSVPSGVTITSAVYRGWFRARTTLATSNARVIYNAGSGDVDMYLLAALSGDENFLDGSFTFDLFAAGFTTVALLRSLVFKHSTSDAVAGVTPAVLDVDAGCIELAGAFT